MNWSNVRLILAREIRDQLRDRRTLFMIVVLPIVLYPLLGMSFFQIVQFRQEKPTRVLVLGGKNLAELEPPLVADGRFCPGLFSDAAKARLLELEFVGADGPDQASADQRRLQGRRAVQMGQFDAALYFADDFAARLAAYRQALSEKRFEIDDRAKVPLPEIIYSTSSDRSQMTYNRLSDVLRNWNEQLVEGNLSVSGAPEGIARPLVVKSDDIANAAQRGAAWWSKILPVLLLVWALTGAFYPAIDLCAGEKERGTLETLLSSPAERSEIVVGKLVTIMIFSMVTATLNLLSMGMTGSMIIGRVVDFGNPPALAAVWLLLALIPISALFSALALALASFARSTKEGQYYLMPLMLVVMPLAVLSTAPGMELTMGNSLIPVTGIVLFLRSMIEGNYMLALRFAAPVIAVTLSCCLLAIRWAVDQFNSEAVLFRESERLDVGLWLRHLVRDRQTVPTAAAALTCGVVILLVRFFLGFTWRAPENFADFARLAVATQVVVILAPTLLMTLLLTRGFRATLLLRWPKWWTLPAAALLAVVLHPVVTQIQLVVNQLYPITDEVRAATEQFLLDAPSLGWLLLLFAVIPAVCEELAFRGFILSGFRQLGDNGRAIVGTALLFGLTHAIFQQSVISFLLGLVIGYLAVQSNSLLPCVLFHMVHNAVALASTRLPKLLEQTPLAQSLYDPQSHTFDVRVTVAGLLASVLILAWFRRAPRGQQSAHAASTSEPSPADAQLGTHVTS